MAPFEYIQQLLESKKEKLAQKTIDNYAREIKSMALKYDHPEIINDDNYDFFKENCLLITDDVHDGMFGDTPGQKSYTLAALIKILRLLGCDDLADEVLPSMNKYIHDVKHEYGVGMFKPQEKEDYRPWSLFVRAHFKRMIELETLVDKFEKDPSTILTSKNVDTITYALITAFTVLHAPTRSELGAVIIRKEDDGDEFPTVEEGRINVLYIHADGRMSLNIMETKMNSVKSTFRMYNSFLRPELVNIINQSLVIFPRKFLFCATVIREGTSSFGENVLLLNDAKIFRKKVAVAFRGVDPLDRKYKANIPSLRQIYANAVNGLIPLEQDAYHRFVANKMLHTFDTHANSYIKDKDEVSVIVNEYMARLESSPHASIVSQLESADDFFKKLILQSRDEVFGRVQPSSEGDDLILPPPTEPPAPTASEARPAIPVRDWGLPVRALDGTLPHRQTVAPGQMPHSTRERTQYHAKYHQLRREERVAKMRARYAVKSKEDYAKKKAKLAAQKKEEMEILNSVREAEARALNSTFGD
jgi:hypothetical protein